MAELPVWIVLFILSGSLHEFAHAWTAWKLGDATAEAHGRLTLNPIAHVDPIGLLVLIVTSLGGFGFGWMKPVPVTPWNLKNPRRDLMLISAAGPLSNVMQAIIWLLIAKIAGATPELNATAPLDRFFGVAVSLNVILAVFNLLPFAPLDGFAVMLGLLPQWPSIRYEKWAGRYGPLILILIFIFPPVQAITIWPMYMFVDGLLRLAVGL